MNRIIFLCIMIVITVNGYSQAEFNTKFKAIPPKTIPPKEKKERPLDTKDLFAEKPIIKAPNVFKNPEVVRPSTYKIGENPDSFSMIKKSEFINPGDIVMDKMGKDLDKTLVREGLKENSGYLVKKDVSFGDIRTKSSYFVIKCRDFGEIDGDLIKASLNNEAIRSRLALVNSYQEFRIYFKDGINIFELEALNRGFLGGNTAEFQIYDDKGKFVRSDFWENWDTGVKGKFIIVKE